MKIYVFQADGRFCKVGISSSVKSRLMAVRTGCPFKLDVVFQLECEPHLALPAEQHAHSILASHRTTGEWFQCTADDAIAAVRAGLSKAREDVMGWSEAQRVMRKGQDRSNLPTHPGAILRADILPTLRKSKSEIADLLGVSRQTLHNVLSEKSPLTISLAVRIGKLTGANPTLLINMQGTYDVAVLSEAMADEVEKIPTMEALEDA